jgi:N-methylhydantoinase A/oxoprolinase/acetone carboxylase beta subunit
MSDLVLLGIDTGGTYTDAVIVTDEIVPRVQRSAKALTTHHDLAIGIREAMTSVVDRGEAPRVGLVSVSTTLATNAIVEGHGGQVCLVTMGFDPHDLARGDIDSALRDGTRVSITGGHSSHGEELAALDLDELDRALVGLDVNGFTGFAVVGQFAVRNTAHEEMVRDHLRQRFGIGVTCSHELTAKLDGPKRAVTSVLNARLLGLIDDLVTATRAAMASLGIDAPLMAVRGDGTLMAADLATERPIETVLSGPAASVIAAQHLARYDGSETSTLDRAIVADIGGTTTDIAVLRDSKVRLRTEGASVGGHDTMVEAVDVHTVGLGGDSEVTIDDRGDLTQLVLGPRRVIPVAVLATLHPDAVRPVLDRQVRSSTTPHLAGSFAVLRQAGPHRSGQNDHERFILDGLGGGPAALCDLVPTKRHEIALDRLVRAGLIARSGFTPTDAAHVLDLHDGFDAQAAESCAGLLARTRDRRNVAVAGDGRELATRTVAELRRRTVDAVLALALRADGFDDHPDRHSLLTAGLNRHRGMIEVDARLGVPLVGLGASAAVYHPEAARRLGTEFVLFDHAAVANAIGAAVGTIRVRRETTITRKKNGVFMATGVGHASLDAAMTGAIDVLGEEVRGLAARAGADDVDIEVERVDNVVEIGGEDVFIDTRIVVTGSGRPTRATSRSSG